MTDGNDEKGNSFPSVHTGAKMGKEATMEGLIIPKGFKVTFSKKTFTFNNMRLRMRALSIEGILIEKALDDAYRAAQLAESIRITPSIDFADEIHDLALGKDGQIQF